MISVIGALVGSAAACANFEAATAPSYQFVKVVVHTTGGDLDDDGYAATLDASRSSAVSDKNPGSFLVEPGTYSVTLAKVASNCTVSGPNPRTVPVAPREIASVTFEVACVPTGVSLAIRATGPDSPDGFRVLIDDLAIDAVVGEARSVGRLTPKTYGITLVTPAHCSVAGGNRIDVVVVSKTVTPVPFDVTCVPAVRLEKIAYVSIDKQQWIEVVNVDGSGELRLRPGYAPAWSPSGKQLAYSDAVCDVGFYSYYGDVCTGGLVLLDPEVGNLHRPEAAKLGAHSSWSRSGNDIVFDTVNPDSSNFELRILQASTSIVSGIVPGPVQVKSRNEPSWSPDGARLAFACRSTTSADLCLMNRDGTALEFLTSDAETDVHPAWSPDGTRIAFTRYPAGSKTPASADVAMMDVATRRITSLGKGRDAAWSRDGSQLVFAGTDGLFVMSATGANRRRLTTGAHDAPTWRP